MDLPLEQTALVLIDLWHDHFIESWIERAGQVLREKVLPVIDAARKAGLPIIHAPCPEVAAQYEQLKRHEPAEPRGPAPDWPPAEFRRREGAYHAYRGPREQEPGIRDIREDRRMSDLVEVQSDDIVIATGQQMHTYLESQGVLQLIFAGFATNWCILNRDYGIKAMRERGYNTILLRDATTGVEFPDTLDGLWATELAIREVEQKYGFSASNNDFFKACDSQ
jgi:nicotinamidase-related amidase